jgi:hypothetical protein
MIMYTMRMPSAFASVVVGSEDGSGGVFEAEGESVGFDMAMLRGAWRSVADNA